MLTVYHVVNILTAIPLKQGLKLVPNIFEEKKNKDFNSNSIKTRIETCSCGRNQRP